MLIGLEAIGEGALRPSTQTTSAALLLKSRTPRSRLRSVEGAQLGSTFTTATIAAGQTLQLSSKDIEGSAGITAAAGVNYTIQITGPFVGYAQHIIFNPVTGQLADLSSFRNRGGSGGVTSRNFSSFFEVDPC